MHTTHIAWIPRMVRSRVARALVFGLLAGALLTGCAQSAVTGAAGVKPIDHHLGAFDLRLPAGYHDDLDPGDGRLQFRSSSDVKIDVVQLSACTGRPSNCPTPSSAWLEDYVKTDRGSVDKFTPLTPPRTRDSAGPAADWQSRVPAGASIVGISYVVNQSVVFEPAGTVVVWLPDGSGLIISATTLVTDSPLSAGGPPEPVIAAMLQGLSRR